MDSPPPTQVPLSRESFPIDSRMHPASPPPSMVSSSNGLGASPPHGLGAHLDRDGELHLVGGMSNGLAMAGHTPLTLAAAQAHAAALAQYHNHMVAQVRHSSMNPMSPLIRKNLITKPGAPYPSPPPVSGDHACKMIKYRERDVAAFMVENRELICLPQAFDLFLKDLVGGLHTVYTKLKRLDIQPVVCNVEQVRILRGLGAIAPGVNRCKLISCSEFDVLYEDCTNSNARPGRPPKRSPSIHHANPETLDKLTKKREEMGFSFDPRYYGEPKTTMMNGFSHSPWATHLPYLHMGMNPAAAMMGQPSMSAMLAASQFAMRADGNAAAAAAAAAGNGGLGKDRMDSEAMGRQGQERLAGMGLFSPPSLPRDHPLVSRHPDDPKPINLSNGHARSNLVLPAPPSGKEIHTDDDDDDDMVHDDKNMDDDNDPDEFDHMDDNSNDAASDAYSGRDMDKGPGSVLGGGVGEGRPELTPVNGGSLGMPDGQTPSELEKYLQGLVDMTQKALAIARCSQQQSRMEKDELLTVQRDYQILVKDLEANLKDARAKNEELMSLLKKEKKERRLQETASEGRRSGSPGHNGGATVTHPDLGLDLAMKAAVPSPEEHSRTQSTDAVESEAEGEKTKAGSDRDMKFAEPADRGCHRESFDMFSAAAALASSGAVAGGSPTVRFPAPYLPLIGGEVQ